MPTVDAVSGMVVDAAFHIHRDIGPGLLESVYEAILASMLCERGLLVERQKCVSFDYRGLHFDDACRVDLLVDRQVVVELKSVEKLLPIHAKQVLTYLRVLDLRVGLLVNFGAPTFKEGMRRVVNDYQLFRDGPLPLHVDL